MTFINALVEGDIDEAVADRLIKTAGHQLGNCFGKRGHDYIRKKIKGFNRGAVAPLLSLVDLMDTGEECAPDVVRSWIPQRKPIVLFRVVVREIESWILADRANLAAFLAVDPIRMPQNPEQIADPKLQLINLARRSSKSKVRSALVPEQGSTAVVGKLYNSEMVRFIRAHWDVAEARKNAASLDSCLKCLQSIA